MRMEGTRGKVESYGNVNNEEGLRKSNRRRRQFR